MAMAPSSIAHRTTGSAGDWSSPLSGVSTGAPEIGSPTEKRKEPRTRWPSTVETFLHATVYVPSERGASPTDNPAGSAGSWMLSPSSTLPPPASSTRISLRPGSTGSVNRTTTRAGASLSTELGAGSADARLAWARTTDGAANATASPAPRRHARSPAYRRFFSISALAGLMPHPLLLDRRTPMARPATPSRTPAAPSVIAATSRGPSESSSPSDAASAASCAC